jgi:phosphoribosylformimino-5-aminoimidazole carboxamide ribotide isomerase
VARVVVGSWAVDDPQAVAELARDNPGQVAVGLDHRHGKIQVRGWQEGAAVTVEDMVDQLSGVAAFIVTDIERDGTLAGPDTAGLAALASRTDVAVIASGGVGSLDDIAALAGIGVEGVIVGKALYEGRFTVEEALTACAR